MKISNNNSLKDFSISLITVGIVWAVAKFLVNNTEIPISLLAQLLVFASYIYFAAIVYKYFISLFESKNKLDTNNLAIPKEFEQKVENKEVSVKNTLSTLGNIFSVIVVVILVLVFLVFMAIGYGGK